jgi:hypothetical protein
LELVPDRDRSSRNELPESVPAVEVEDRLNNVPLVNALAVALKAVSVSAVAQFQVVV